jgi:hypothetical protein
VDPSSPLFSQAVGDLVGRLRVLKTVSNMGSPLVPANVTLRARDGRSLLVTFSLAGDMNQAQKNVDAALAATAATARVPAAARRGVRSGEFQ